MISETISSNVTSGNEPEAAEGVPFPVTDLLNGIYNFVSSYIKPKQPQPAAKQEVVNIEKILEDEDDGEIEIEAIPRPTLIGPQPLNAHTIPRDQLIVEAVDEEHSDSDPFFQVNKIKWRIKIRIFPL